MVDVIILAGGFGTRLKSISKDVPKPLISISNKVFLDFIIEWLEINNFHKALLSIHYRPDIFKEYIDQKKGLFELIPIIEDIPLGTGGAIKNVINHYDLSDPFIVLNGDSLNNFNLQEMLSKYLIEKQSLIGIYRVTNSDRYGYVNFDGKLATSFIEKDSSKDGWINNGSYILKKEIFNNYNGQFSLEREVLPNLVRDQKLQIFKCEGEFIDIGTPDDLERFRNKNKLNTRV